MNQGKLISVLVLLIFLSSFTVNCSSSDNTTTADPTPIQTEPDFIGDIIEVLSIGESDVLGTILVEGTDVIQSSDKYVVTVKMETLILEQDGKIVNRISFADIESDQQVRIWFSGAVRESYPAQVDAAQIMMVNNQNEQGSGTLAGHVTIGPIEPVVQPGDDPGDVPPEVYDARKIMIYDASGEDLIKQVDIGHDGNYNVELATGAYLVDINNLGIDYSDQVPVNVEILIGETVQLDIDIDTGIR